MKPLFQLLASLLVSALLCAPGASAQPAITTLDAISRHVAATGFSGTVLVHDLRADQYLAGDAALAQQRFIPASTFKIFSALVALETGVIADINAIMPWDGVVRGRTELNRDLTLLEGFRLSAVPHFQALVREIGDHYGLHLDPDATVADLSAGMRQRVELIKCLRRDPKIVILDEPTSVLTPQESQQLFHTLREVVAREGRAVALVSHKLAEIMHATDVVTIMRQGAVVDHHPTASTTAEALAQAMVGRAVSLRGAAAALGATDVVEELASEGDAAAASAQAADERPVVLRVSGATLRQHGVALLDGLSLEVRRGEIVGVAGVEGNGQRELGDVLSSLVTLDSGTVEVLGTPVRTGRAGAMARAGVAVIPEDRHHSGCVLDMSVAENLVLDRVGSVARMGVIDRTALRDKALQLMADFEISAAGPDAPLRSLSGGNQQRVVLARELSHEPTVLVAAQPTRGLDVGAIEYMSARLRQAADAGIAVLLISTELEEIMHLSDRIVVLSRGAVIGELDARTATAERLGLLLGGVAV